MHGYAQGRGPPPPRGRNPTARVLLLAVRANLGKWPDQRRCMNMQRICEGCIFVFEAHSRERNPRRWCSGACRVAFRRSGVRRSSPHPKARDTAASDRIDDRLCPCGHTAPNAKGPVPDACPDCIEQDHMRECAMCGREYRARLAAGRFCSPSCKARAYANGRTRRVPPENPRSYDRTQIFERDGWVCGFCGGPVSRTSQWPADDSPTIDHRIPVSEGGSDDDSNIRLAHWLCNLRRAAAPELAAMA